MTCERCGSERSYQFEASPAAQPRPEAAELPLVCRDCGLITIGGVAVSLPEKLEHAARGLAEAQAEEAAKASEEIEGVDRVELYMQNFFKAAYLEGFFRALAFFRHNVKEGRLVRLRELWKDGVPMTSQVAELGDVTGRIFQSEAYTEFERLLQPHKGDPNGSNPENQCPPEQEHHA